MKCLNQHIPLSFLLKPLSYCIPILFFQIQKMRIKSIIVQLLLCNLVRSYVNRIILNKCCPVHQIMDPWQRCVDIPRHLKSGHSEISSALESIILTNMCSKSEDREYNESEVNSDSICNHRSDYKLEFSWSPGNVPCPTISKIELPVMDIEIENILKVHHVKQENGKRKEDSFLLDPTFVRRATCVDMALLASGEVEGPFVEFCQSDLPRDINIPTGSLTKCCGRDEILDPLMSYKCVKMSSVFGQNWRNIQGLKDNWQPKRILRELYTGGVIFKHFLKYFEKNLHDENVCEVNDGLVHRNPLALLEDRKAVLTISGEYFYFLSGPNFILCFLLVAQY